MKHKVSKRVISLKWVTFICISFFVLGAIFTSKSWEPSSDSGSQLTSQRRRDHELQIVSDDCAHKKVCFLIQFSEERVILDCVVVVN
ncbi:hypothetical protein HID58_041114 [Brassica napus]|uniref:DUF4094 domain-containing protein n=2 Tax=Brassica TaxID=3705 RepID=A0ABQ8BBJ1_BRANA|nr:hypothetical protein HID58_041114 [Brassica napus]